MANNVRFSATLDDKVSTGLQRISDKFELLGGKGSAASLFGNIGAKAVAVGFGLIEQGAASAIGFLEGTITHRRRCCGRC